MKDKFDNVWIGITSAIVVPLIVLSIYAAATRQYGTLGSLYHTMMNNPDVRLQILTIGIIPNLFLFYFVNNRLQMNDFTRGFVLVTVLMGLGAIIWTQLLT